MNFLSIFVLIPILILVAMYFARKRSQINIIAALGGTALLIMSGILTWMYFGERAAGNEDIMLFRADMLWYEAFNIHYSVGVDGVSVAMLLLTSVIVFTGVFASWRIDPLPREFFLWFWLLSAGVYGFFITIDLFSMFMFYEIALIPMYLLIGLWGTGKKEYSAMLKL